MDFFDKKCVVSINFYTPIFISIIQEQNLFSPFENESREQETQTYKHQAVIIAIVQRIPPKTIACYLALPFW